MPNEDASALGASNEEAWGIKSTLARQTLAKPSHNDAMSVTSAEQSTIAQNIKISQNTHRLPPNLYLEKTHAMEHGSTRPLGARAKHRTLRASAKVQYHTWREIQGTIAQLGSCGEGIAKQG